MIRIQNSSIWVLLVLLSLLKTSSTCWSLSKGIGDTTVDYDLLVGEELIINCSLKASRLPSVSIPVNSSFLVFKKDSYPELLTRYVHQTGPLSAQLRIPKAQVDDSGVYHCKMVLPDNPHALVCSTNVNVGYPPKNVTNFKCISRNFDNLTCTWDIEPNNIRTNYSLQKMLVFQNYFQNCPKPHNNTFCQWRSDTDPPYMTMSRSLRFRVHGNNTLGVIVNEFNLDHNDIVIPNSPSNPIVTKVGKTFGEVKWSPPKMDQINKDVRPDLYYQLWLEELMPMIKEENYAYDKVVIDAGVEQYHYRLEGLIPNFRYNISLRCRLNHTSREGMWSPVVSIIFDTGPDVPYISPEVNPEAFVIHNYESYRNSTLYWKPVLPRFYNGENFHYHIVYFQAENINLNPSLRKNVTSYVPSVKIGHLNNDSSYIFHIYSANQEGLSDDFQTIFIDERNKIPSSPKDIRAISHDLGYYNLSWSVPGDIDYYKFIVFWCSGRKPGQCDEHIQWSDVNVKENSFSLDVRNASSNFQFAVAATYMNKSTGMQWASCIVSNEAPLGPISISHIQPTSNTLRILWKLDCEAQKSVIDHYVITYCAESFGCNADIIDSDVLGYTIEDLHPFTNYSVKLRAFNLENKPSEDVDSMYQSTLSGDPKDSPQSVKFLWRNDSAFNISWTPPKEPNGIITHYLIYQNEYKHYMKDTSSCKNCEFQIKTLRPYTYYNISIQACVNKFCSPKSSPISILTDVGVPGIMDPPRIETANDTHLKISWTTPIFPNGPIDFYDIQQKEENGNDSINYTVTRNHTNTMFVEIKCLNVLEGGIKYLFYIRAGNMKKGIVLYGPYSDPTTATACVMSQGLAMIIGIAIGGTLALAVFLLLAYKLFRWMSEKIHQVKNIAVRLPKELEGPEMNPLNNYESFKNGLAVPNGKVEHLSYVIEQAENKNRHGSGSSQFSNSSTEELIFKNGRCTKFGRKPSGDSSGCSSMSSNTTNRIHLSSECGTESDSMVPSSPDSVLTDQNFLTGYKPPMPILLETYDTSDNQETHLQTDINEQLKKYNNFVNGMVLKVDQPYSKFGISGNVTSSIPCQINPLAFYSCNLANSEPSVFETNGSKKPNFSVPPYSKVGLAKSSGDILGISKRNSKEMGYSKFGFETPNYFPMDKEKLNPTVGIALVENTPHFFRFDNANCDLIKSVQDPWPYTSPLKGNKKICASTPLGENKKSKALSPGYVSVSEMRNGLDYNNTSSSTSSVNDDNSVVIPGEFKFDLKDLNYSLPLKDVYDLSFLKKDLGSNPSEDINTSLDEFTSGLSGIHPSNVNSAEDSLTENYCNHSIEQSQNPDLLDSLHTECGLSSSPVSEKPTFEEETSTKPNEVLLTPATVRGGYVPFSTLSNLCDPQVSTVPNTSDSNVPLSIFPGDICSDIDNNYITPSNKGDMKLLQDSLTTRNKPFSSYLHCNSNDSSADMNSPLKYFLQPLPKMETEICEV